MSTTEFRPFLPFSFKISRQLLEDAQGSLLFADISGFTRMSERLARHGHAGTETLTNILNGYFDKMIGIVRKHQGRVLRFTGDAVLVYFQADDIALKAAEEMMNGMKEFKDIQTDHGKFSLHMKTIISTGKWHEFFLGNSQRQELFMCGKLIKKLAAEEDIAKRGEIRIIRDNEKQKPIQGFDRLDIPSPKALLPEGVEKIISKGLYGENRSVACGFLKISGYDESSPDFQYLNTIFNIVLDKVHRYGGTVQLIDNITSHGFKLMILFGAPIAIEGMVKRSVLSLMEITKELKKLADIKFQAGMDQGYVYAGIIGNEWRRIYTVIGDTVNTAARLMGSAGDGELIISENMRRILKKDFDFIAHDPVKVKGKRRNLKRFSPVKKQDLQQERSEFVGRKSEIDSLVGFLTSKGDIAVINGEAGIGKTAIATEYAAIMKEKGYNILWGSTNDLRPSYYTITSILVKNSGINEYDPPSLKKQKFKEHIFKLIRKKRKGVKSHPLYSKITLLGEIFLGLNYPKSTFRNLPNNLKADNLLNALEEYFTVFRKSFLLVLEDLHFASAEEVSLLEKLSAKIIRNSEIAGKILVIKRPRLAQFYIPEDIRGIALNITGLERSDVKQFIVKMLKNHPLSGKLTTYIIAKTEGNPFYLDQYLQYLKEKGYIQLKNEKWVTSKEFSIDSLPENVFSMIMARIDRLGEKTKESLRIASVVGLEFKKDVVESILRAPVNSALLQSLDEKLTYMKSIIELEYIFSHAIIRDVIYDSILKRKRTNIHKEIAEILLEKSPAEAEVSELAAYHFLRADEFEKALQYSLMAAEYAKQSFRNDDALGHFADAENLVKRKFPDKLDEMFRIKTQKGELLSLRSLADAAERSYKEALALAKGLKDTRKVLASCFNLIMFNINQGKYKEGLKICVEAKKYINGKEDKMLKARIFVSEAQLYYFTDQYDKQFESLDIVEGLIDMNSPSLVLCTYISNRGMYLENLGKLRESKEAYQTALIIARKLNSMNNVGSNLSNIGVIHCKMGEMEKGMEHFQNALKIFRRIGDNRFQAMVLNNIGLIHSNCGNLKKSMEVQLQAYRLRRKSNDKYSLAMSLYNLADLNNSLGNYTKAKEQFERSLILCEEIGHKYGINYIYMNMGALEFHLGHTEKGIEYYHKALELNSELGNESGIGTCYGGLGEIYWELEELREAEDFYSKQVEIDKKIGKKFDILIGSHRLAVVTFFQGRVEEALAFINAALDRSSGTKSPTFYITALLSKAEMISYLGDHSKARNLYEEALSIARENNLDRSISLIQVLLLEETFFSNKESEIEKLKTLVFRSRRISYQRYRSIGRYWEHRGEFKKAIMYFNKALSEKGLKLYRKRTDIELCLAGVCLKSKDRRGTRTHISKAGKYTEKYELNLNQWTILAYKYFLDGKSESLSAAENAFKDHLKNIPGKYQNYLKKKFKSLCEGRIT
ncbi:tetratricopeptide repeat protein [bacterium]|nr:tetratricopeptide repeat protein [bacterium]